MAAVMGGSKELKQSRANRPCFFFGLPNRLVPCHIS